MDVLITSQYTFIFSDTIRSVQHPFEVIGRPNTIRYTPTNEFCYTFENKQKCLSIECWFLPSVWKGQILGSNLTVPMPRTRPYGPPDVFLKTFDKVKCLHILFLDLVLFNPLTHRRVSCT